MAERLYEERLRAPAAWHILSVLMLACVAALAAYIALVARGGSAATMAFARWALPALAVLFVLELALYRTFAGLHVELTSRGLRLAFGPFSTRIPLVRVVDAVREDVAAGACCRMPGVYCWRGARYWLVGRGPAVQVRESSGGRVTFSCSDPEAFLQALSSALEREGRERQKAGGEGEGV